MNPGRRLSSALPAPVRERIASDAGFDDALDKAIEDARSTWPSVVLPEDRFLAHLAEKLGPTEAPRALSELCVADLYLACAAAHGDRLALEELDRITSVELRKAKKRFGYLPVELDDIRQRTLQRLLVAQQDCPPKILEYAGLGELKAWVKVTIVRTLINASSRESRELPEEERFFQAFADGASDGEKLLLRSAFQNELRTALTTAVATLTAREKSLLQYAYVDGRTVAEIGAVYGVHGATASRWLTRVRERLLKAVRENLMQRLKISESEASSVIRRALSHIDLTLNRLLES